MPAGNASTKTAGHENPVAGFRPGTGDCVSGWHFTSDGNIDDERSVPRIRVSADDDCFEFVGQGTQSFEKLLGELAVSLLLK